MLLQLVIIYLFILKLSDFGTFVDSFYSFSLEIAMPVGFVGVADSKRCLAASGLPQIHFEGSRAVLAWWLLL